MRKRWLWAVLVVMTAVGEGCSTQSPQPGANPGPLPTGDAVQPIQGCKDLRARGGAC